MTLKINYITNQDLKSISGGGSGVNNATIKQLKKNVDLNIIPPINPSIDTIAKIKSVFARKIRMKGNYHFFSEKRLQIINKEFKNKTKREDCDAFFFHGFTPWIKIKPNKPYFCFNDACFATYVNIYNNPDEFDKTDLKRIYSQETSWLSNAEKVFFRSQWALEETKKHYNVTGENFRNVGVGGFIDIPKQDNYTGGYNFLFVSREFIPKGGLVVSEAIKIVIEKYPEAKLWIVGQPPPDEIIQQKGIEYKGLLNKNNETQKQKLIALFSKSFALIHPTTKDTNTLVINELAYYGCPAIASNRFAIPEYLLDGKTGLLLDEPTNHFKLADLMCRMIEDKSMYDNMRIEARKNALINNTWDKVGERITKIIKESIKKK